MDWDDTLTWIDKSFSADPNKDLVFYNWNRVFALYCDGTCHQGYKHQPLKIQEKNIYFHGYNNTMTHLNWIMNKLPPENTDTFTFYGYSAGGIGVLTWIETV